MVKIESINELKDIAGLFRNRCPDLVSQVESYIRHGQLTFAFKLLRDEIYEEYVPITLYEYTRIMSFGERLDFGDEKMLLLLKELIVDDNT